jgi:hypothetical protein
MAPGQKGGYTHGPAHCGRGYLESILKEFNFMRTLKLSVHVVLAFSFLGSCMSIPASIIDAEAWMHKEPAFHPRQKYASDWGGA